MSYLSDNEPCGECDECEEIFSGEGAIRTYLREDKHGGMVCVKCLYCRALDKTINAATVDLQTRSAEAEKRCRDQYRRAEKLQRRVNNLQSLLARERYWKRAWSGDVRAQLLFLTNLIKDIR